MLAVLDTGIVYRNSKPHLRAVHAWHPSLVHLGDGELLAAFDLGQAVESLDYATYTSRSTDGGRSWNAPRRLFQDATPVRTTHSVRLGHVADGKLVGLGGRFYRHDDDEGLVNRANLGYVPMDLIWLQSSDGGWSWTPPRRIEPPLVGPSFEICHRIVALRDGRWLAPTHTWRGWNGEQPNGMQAIALVSHDQGNSWPDYLQVANQTARGVFSWEQGLTQLADGRLLAVVWCYEEQTGRSLPNRYALSSDGRSFSEPRENGLMGETAKIITLADGRVLCLYRRLDRAGLWAVVARINGDQWLSLEELPIWQGMPSGMSGRHTAGDELSALKFGFPSMVELPDGSVMAVFWCVEDCLHIIRWVKLHVGRPNA